MLQLPFLFFILWRKTSFRGKGIATDAFLSKQH